MLFPLENSDLFSKLVGFSLEGDRFEMNFIEEGKGPCCFIGETYLLGVLLLIGDRAGFI